MYILHANFCACSFNRTQNLIFPIKFEKKYDNSIPQQAKLTKTRSIPCCKISILHANFFTIPCNGIRDRTNTRRKKQNGNAPWAAKTQITSLLFQMIYILYIFFCAISSTRHRNQRIPKISENWNYSATYWVIFPKVDASQFTVGLH